MLLVVLLVAGCGMWADDEGVTAVEGERPLCDEPYPCFDATVEDFADALPGLDFTSIRFVDYGDLSDVSYWRASGESIYESAGRRVRSVYVELEGRANSGERIDTIYEVRVKLYTGGGEPSEVGLREFSSVVEGVLGVAVPGWTEGPSWVRENMGKVAGVENAEVTIVVVAEGGTGVVSEPWVVLLGPCLEDERGWCTDYLTFVVKYDG
ncbi:MAG: hypothetical protein OXI33_06030 [Chloroflexota bacterium]|nr:hypothetical protein [Chloroflexota bacterium]